MEVEVEEFEGVEEFALVCGEVFDDVDDVELLEFRCW